MNEMLHINEIRLIPRLLPENMSLLLQWANSGGPAFLKQFAGPKWHYPLTENQLAGEAGTLFSIFEGDSFTGMIQRFPKDGRVVRIGRFLIDPARTGWGIGGAALRLLCRDIFREADVDAVALNVYLFNARALRCYGNCGFRVDVIHEEWENCSMKLTREAFEKSSEEELKS